MLFSSEGLLPLSFSEENRHAPILLGRFKFDTHTNTCTHFGLSFLFSSNIATALSRGFALRPICDFPRLPSSRGSSYGTPSRLATPCGGSKWSDGQRKSSPCHSFSLNVKRWESRSAASSCSGAVATNFQYGGPETRSLKSCESKKAQVPSPVRIKSCSVIAT